MIIRYVGSCRGVEFVKSKGFEAVRLGHGLLPTGLELAISSWMGANGTATVRVWGPWAMNTGWKPPTIVVEGDSGEEQCHEYRVELLDWSHYEELYPGELSLKCCGVQDREKPDAPPHFSTRHSFFFFRGLLPCQFLSDPCGIGLISFGVCQTGKAPSF